VSDNGFSIQHVSQLLGQDDDLRLLHEFVRVVDIADDEMREPYSTVQPPEADAAVGKVVAKVIGEES
jgi:hypothetical protein